MVGAEPVKLERIRRRIEARDADLSGSTFANTNLSGAAFRDVTLAGATIDDANLAEVRISDANLTNVSIADSRTDGMTIDGIPVAALLAAWRAANPPAV
jgi:uncharacterized protein YjbI with pentapeptide repeats